MQVSPATKKLIKQALKEDMPQGDITTNLFVDGKQQAVATVVAKAEIVVCGLEVFQQVFRTVDRKVQLTILVKNGQKLKKGQEILQIAGNKSSILKAERVALNLIQHLSGVATKTARLVQHLAGTDTRLLDTRKTIPGMRDLQKQAVVYGGGDNHRMSLSDMVLIKENHLQHIDEDQLEERVKLAQKKGFKVEIECADLKQLEKFIKLGVDIIMLDNMTAAQIKKAMSVRKAQKANVKFEISGNVTEENIAKYAKLGVDFISTGSITHSATAADISLLIQ